MTTISYNKPTVVFESEGFLVFYGPTHPLARQNGLVAYHRHVLSLSLDRWLTPVEVVIFEDNNPLNVDLENMKLISRADLIRQHSPFHQDGRTVEITCLRSGCGRSKKMPVSHAARFENHYCSQPVLPAPELRSWHKWTDSPGECAKVAGRKFDPSKEELAALVWAYPKEKIGKMYGVSDRAVGKRCKLLGIKSPVRGYWAKIQVGQRDPSSGEESIEFLMPKIRNW